MTTRSSSMNWRRIQERYNLIGNECKTCGRVFFPLRRVCPECRRKGRLIPRKLKGTGEVVSYTLINSPPARFELEAPYIIAMVKLDEGPVITAQMADCSLCHVEIGSKVKTVFRKITEDGNSGLIHYGFKFKLADQKTCRI